MPGFIPRDFIDSVLEQTDIVSLIDSRVSLKKKGRDYLACCPFHNEKTPSFNVSPQKQFYHCYGCGVNGNAITFLMEYEHLEFPDAIEELADRLGLTIPRIQGKQDNYPTKDKKSLFQLMTLCADFYHQQLKQQNQSSDLSLYLQKRNLSTSIIEAYQIGYSPDSWNSTHQLLIKHQADNSTMLDTGLIIHNEEKQRYYDRFRHRLMFPVRDRRGRTIAFGGRVIIADDAQAKYINSPETPLFHKSEHLYGFYEMTQALRKIEKVLVVEGYMDVVALAQYGVRNVVATLGTATTQQHIQRLFRSASEIIFCFDGDRAGKEAAWKALKTTLEIIQAEKKIRFLFLPDGEDPDSYIQSHGKEQFEQQIEQAMPLSDFFFAQLQTNLDLDNDDSRSQLIALAKPYLQMIPADNSYFLIMKERLSKLTGVSITELNSLLTQQQQFSRPVYTLQKKNTLSPVWKAVHYLLHYPELASMTVFADFFSQLKDDGVDIFIRLLELFQYNPNYSSAQILLLWENKTEADKLKQLLTQTPLIDEQQAVYEEYKEIISHLQQKPRQLRIEQLQFIHSGKGLNSSQLQEYQQLSDIR